MFGSLLCLMSGIGAVRAQTCATPPSCASLGYTMTSSECSGQPTLVCPFDASAVFCAGTASSGGAGGSTGGGAGSSFIENGNGDSFVGFLENSDGSYLKLIQKYKFVDGVSSSQCADACLENGLSNFIYTSEIAILNVLCAEADKTSGTYYYRSLSGQNGLDESATIIDCSNKSVSTLFNKDVTGCLCARVIG